MINKFSQFIFNRFKSNEIRLHELSYLFWECTRRCNLRCLHCGSDCTADSAIPDMPFEGFLTAILPLKKMYKPDTITVAITGGEPLLRGDLALCGRTLREHGFRWGMVTNGFGYTPEIHGKLLAAGMGSVTVSLDGLEDTHNWLRANSGSFNRAVKAIDLIAAEQCLVYDIVTCVNQKNIYELEKLKQFLIQHQVKAWRLFTISPIGRAALNDELRLTDKELKILMDFIAGSRAVQDGITVTFSCEAYTGKYEQRVRDSYFFCRAGIQIASVLADGSVSACPNINRNFIQGNIYTDSFDDIWNNRFEVMRDRRWTRTGRCRDCADYRNCLGGAMHLWNEKKDTIMTCIHYRLKGQ